MSGNDMGFVAAGEAPAAAPRCPPAQAVRRAAEASSAKVKRVTGSAFEENLDTPRKLRRCRSHTVPI